MVGLIPSAYMTVRLRNVKTFLKNIPQNKTSSFTIEEIGENKNPFLSIIAKRRIASYLSNIGILVRLNNHYKINIDNQIISNIHFGLLNEVPETYKAGIREFILEDEMIQDILRSLSIEKDISLRAVLDFLNKKHEKRFHREQAKFVLCLLNDAGFGKYRPYQRKFIFNNSTEKHFNLVNDNKREFEGLKRIETIVFNGQVLKQITITDENQIYPNLSTEDLIKLNQFKDKIIRELRSRTDDADLLSRGESI